FFLLRYVPRNAGNLWRELSLQPHMYDAANIFGTGTSFVPAFVLLSFVGMFFVRLNWFLGCGLLAGLSSFAVALCFLFGRDQRLYLPLLILLIGIAVLPVTWAANNLFEGRRSIFALAVLALFAAACLGYPSRSGYKTGDIDRSQAWDALNFST